MISAGRMLRTVRRRAGMSQRALAERAGVPQSSIARVESGATVPRVDTLQRLLEATGHQLEALGRIGDGIDRTQIRAMLALTPAERGRAATIAARNLSDLLANARMRERRPSD